LTSRICNQAEDEKWDQTTAEIFQAGTAILREGIFPANDLAESQRCSKQNTIEQNDEAKQGHNQKVENLLEGIGGSQKMMTHRIQGTRVNNEAGGSDARCTIRGENEPEGCKIKRHRVISTQLRSSNHMGQHHDDYLKQLNVNACTRPGNGRLYLLWSHEQRIVEATRMGE
jgi:hypothetical protein